MRTSGGPNGPITVLVGIVSAILLVAVIVLLQAHFYRAEQAENQRKRAAMAPEEFSRLRAEQQALLHAYRWIDPQKSVVAIPIDRAMKLVAAELGGDAAARLSPGEQRDQ